jgi:hypothetical protein
VGLALIGVKDAIGLGVVIVVAASIAGVIGLISGSGWKPPGLMLVVSLIALALA